MATILPPIPKFIFTILEPISLIGGFLASILSTPYFVSSQLPRAYTGTYDDASKLVAWQLGNLYLLMAFLGVFILNTTVDVKVVRAYLWALWLGDIGHVGFSLYAMGVDGILDLGGWSATIWGNTAFTVFLFVSRSLYLGGYFDTRTQTTTGRELRSKKTKAKSKR